MVHKNTWFLSVVSHGYTEETPHSLSISCLTSSNLSFLLATRTQWIPLPDSGWHMSNQILYLTQIFIELHCSLIFSRPLIIPCILLRFVIRSGLGDGWPQKGLFGYYPIAVDFWGGCVWVEIFVITHLPILWQCQLRYQKRLQLSRLLFPYFSVPYTRYNCERTLNVGHIVPHQLNGCTLYIQEGLEATIIFRKGEDVVSCGLWVILNLVCVWLTP